MYELPVHYDRQIINSSLIDLYVLNSQVKLNSITIYFTLYEPPLLFRRLPPQQNCLLIVKKKRKEEKISSYFLSIQLITVKFQGSSRLTESRRYLHRHYNFTRSIRKTVTPSFLYSCRTILICLGISLP